MSPHAPFVHVDDAQPSRLYDGRQAGKRLRIIIIGCGLGGVSAAFCLSQAGHEVTICEKATKLGEVGAGIQASPNVTKLLYRWGLAGKLSEVAVKPEAAVFRRYSTGAVVGFSRWGDAMRREHGAPYYHIHRADLHRMIFNLAIASPRVTVRLNARIASVSPSPRPDVSVTLDSGEVVRGDLIIGADGVKSVVRQAVLGRTELPQATGDAAYRAVIPTDLMMSDPELRMLVEKPEMTTWMGPERHIMGYCIRAKKEYNLVLLHPDNDSVESWTAEGNADKMRADFVDFEPRVQKLLSLVNSTLKWQLLDRMPLERWVHPDGRAVLLGDACHPMLPYRAQGAALALEDATILGNMLSHLTSISHLPHYLTAYEKLRMERSTATQESSRLNRFIFHLPDGPAQQARDISMMKAMRSELSHMRKESRACLNGSWASDVSSSSSDCHGEGENGNLNVQAVAVLPTVPRHVKNEDNANQWADRRKNAEQFSYDADAVADRWWVEEGEGMVRRLEVERGSGSSRSGSSKSGGLSARSWMSVGGSYWKKIAGR